MVKKRANLHTLHVNTHLILLKCCAKFVFHQMHYCHCIPLLLILYCIVVFCFYNLHNEGNLILFIKHLLH